MCHIVTSARRPPLHGLDSGVGVAALGGLLHGHFDLAWPTIESPVLPRGWADALNSAEPAVTVAATMANPTTALQMVLTPLLLENPSLTNETQQFRSLRVRRWHVRDGRPCLESQENDETKAPAWRPGLSRRLVPQGGWGGMDGPANR